MVEYFKQVERREYTLPCLDAKSGPKRFRGLRLRCVRWIETLPVPQFYGRKKRAIYASAG